MKALLNTLFCFRNKIDRKFYFQAGISLMVIKYAVDAITIYAITNIFWTPLDYLFPLIIGRTGKIVAFPTWFSVALVAWTLPFIWIGISMTFRRIINAGKSPWYIILFFVPLFNYLLMLWLCTLPTSEKQLQDEEPVFKIPDKRFRSALIGVLVSVAIGFTAIIFTVFVIEGYGLSIFLLVPFTVGLVSTYLFNVTGKQNFEESMLVAFSSLLLLLVGLILFALEGFICIYMTIPLALPIVFLGAVLGRFIATKSSSRVSVFWCLILFPAFWISSSISVGSDTFKVTTQIEISAPPSEVWEHVIEFEEITREPAWYFQLGFAYPVNARIEGSGVGATRYCRFSTGAFIEPITTWDKPYLLAFNVQEQPPSLQEISFYDKVYAPHINSSFRSQRGEFRLIPTDNGHTVLKGTTWYKLDLYPHFYWQPISEWIVHKIHKRVLEQIAFETENT